MKLPDPPQTAWNPESRTWNFGRFAAPIPTPRFRGQQRSLISFLGADRMRLKEWSYAAVVTERVFLAFGLVQLGYVANAFAYLVDRTRPDRVLEFETMSPLGRALRFAPSSTHGETCWSGRDAQVRIRHGGSWRVELDVPLRAAASEAPTRVRGSFRIVPGESLALLHDLGDARPAYTQKCAGLAVHGSVRVADEAVDLGAGTGFIDWTRSFADRETRWKWASFAGHSQGRRIGLNLSAEVYDDARGHSRENAFWLDDEVRPLSGVVFDVGRQPGVDDWFIRSADGDEVDLRFVPRGARAQHLDLKLLRSHFVQPYGEFEGRVCGQRVQRVFGVVEDHHAVW